MHTFIEWLRLLSEARQALVSANILHGYDAEFKQQLAQLIQRTQDPKLREKFQEMLDCPIQDGRGNCRSFAEYILSALMKNGIHERYDIEAALAYVIEKMLMDKTDAGEPRITVFGGFEERPDYVSGNPLQARFMKFLQFAVQNVRKGKIPRLAHTEARPAGTVSIGLGRWKKGEPFDGGISPDEIAARPSHDADLGELIQDITALLTRKEAASGLPLVAMFKGMIEGQRTEQQRQAFGDRAARRGREVIIDTIRGYAQATENDALMNLLARLQEPSPTTRTAVTKAIKPKLTDKERDFASIVSVIEKLGGRAVGSADLGKYRRRWLEYPPRNPSSEHRNRLEEVLAQMVEEGVLQATRTSRGALTYSPGPKFQEYRRQGEAA